MEEQKKVEFIESYIKIGNGDYKWNDNHGELIRCKDCEKRSSFGEEKMGFCQKDRRWHSLDWFCADGERKQND